MELDTAASTNPKPVQPIVLGISQGIISGQHGAVTHYFLWKGPSGRMVPYGLTVYLRATATPCWRKNNLPTANPGEYPRSIVSLVKAQLSNLFQGILVQLPAENCLKSRIGKTRAPSCGAGSSSSRCIQVPGAGSWGVDVHFPYSCR